MKVTTERLEDCQVNLIIEMDAADIDRELRQTARRISRQFNVPGYRRGRAPFHAVVRVFGREALQQEALEGFGQDLYEKALEEIDYEPFQPGELKDVEWEPFRMTVLLPIEPEVDPGDYRSVRVPFEPEEITEDAVEEYLTVVQQEHTQWVPVERPAAWGDQVVIDAEGKFGDEVVLHNDGYEMVLEPGASHPLPGFHEQIVGLSPGEEKTFELTYPEDDFQEDVAGKEATFTLYLYSVKEKDVPPLDDDLAVMVGDYDALDDLKASVRERMETEALQKAESEYLDKVLEAIIEAAVKIEYPPQAIDREAEYTLDQMERNLAQSGIELDRYLTMLGKTREAYKLDIRPSAEERLRKRLVLRNIAEREELKIEEEQVEAEIDRLAEMMGDQADQMREMLQSPGGRQMAAEDLMMAKVQELVVQIGKGEAPPVEAEQELAEGAQEAETDAQAEAEAVGVIKTEAEAESETASEQGLVTEGDMEPEGDAGVDDKAAGIQAGGGETD